MATLAAPVGAPRRPSRSPAATRSRSPAPRSRSPGTPKDIRSERLARFASRARKLFHDGIPLGSQPLSKWYHPRLCWVLTLTYAGTIAALVSLPILLWVSGSRTLIGEVAHTFGNAHDANNLTFQKETRSLAGNIQLQITRQACARMRHYLDFPQRHLNMTVEMQDHGVPLFMDDNVTYNLQVIWPLLRYTYPEISFIYYADSTGLFIGYGRGGATGYRASYRPPDNITENAETVCPRGCPPVWQLKEGYKVDYYVDSTTGSFGEAFLSRPYDPRARWWWSGAVETGGGLSWGKPHLYSSNRDIGIEFTQAVFEGDRTTVYGASVTLDLMTVFLREAQEAMLGSDEESEPDGRRATFIVDEMGLMVASSQGVEQVIAPEADGSLRQRAWAEIDDPMIRVCETLPHLWGRVDLEGSNTSQNGGLLYAYNGFEFGPLRWTIVSVVKCDTWLKPANAMLRGTEEELAEDIDNLVWRLYSDLLHTVIMCSFIVPLVGLPMILLLAHMITRPLKLICKDMKSIARLEFLADPAGAGSISSEEMSPGHESMASSHGGRGSQRQLAASYVKSLGISAGPSFPIKEVAQMRDDFAAMASGLKSFSRYIDRHVMESLVQSRKQARLSVKPTDVTIFFSDVADFTSIAESLRPEVFMELLSEYLDVMSIIIMRNQGTVGEFIGDTIMAWWNAPVELGEGHTRIALHAALEQQARLEALRSKWCSEGLPEVRANMGLVRGTVLAGNIGCSQRMKYGLVGDSVNLASRLEGLCKRYGVEILIDSGTLAAPAVQEAFHCRPLDLVIVKGRTGTTELYELVARKPPASERAAAGAQEGADVAAFVQDYASILAMYREANFQGAVTALEAYQESWPRDRPAEMLLERCRQHLTCPPSEGWSPVEKLTEK